MLLRILNKNNVAVAGLTKFRELCITSSLDFSDKVLSFEAEISDIKDIVENEGYIETPDDRFVIKEIEEHSDGSATVIAQLDVEALEGMTWPKFVSGGVETNGVTIQAAMQLALAGTGWTILESTVTKKRTMKLTNVSSLDVLKQALKTYRCEVVIDSKNRKLSFYTQIGSNRGAYFKDNLNLTELTVKRSSYDFYTEIEPYGKDGVDIKTVNGGQEYLSNYTYSTKRKRLIWKDERYTILENLKEDAQAKLDDMAKPYVSYAGQVIDLARESNLYDVLDYDLGDTVVLIDSATFTKEQQRIVGLKVYPEEYWRNELTLANKVLTFDEMVQKYEDAAATVDNITTDNGTVKGETVDQIHSYQIVDLENAIVTSAYIRDLDVDRINVKGRLDAVEIHVGNVIGNVGTFEELAADVFTANSAEIDSLVSTEVNAAYGYIDNLLVDYATVENLRAVRGDFQTIVADSGTFEELATNIFTAKEADINSLVVTNLQGVNASINSLNTNYANIIQLLAGNAGIGELQNIHLTSANAVIDQGVIETLLANIAVIQHIITGEVTTEELRIISADESLTIDGNMIQFKDRSGNVRIQIGKDTTGNFTFVLYDESGQGQLMNQNGIMASSIADGLIVDKMVATPGNGYNGISADKLDIASLFRVLNDDGSQTLKASRIYFNEDGQTLTQVYSTMTENITLANKHADNAVETAENAQETASQAKSVAEDALNALQGISTLDALGAVLTNDAHVVHTDFDGTGGVFTEAKTTVKVLLGSSDVTTASAIFATPSAGVTGTWNNNTKTYQVTALSTLNGYVDFDIAYGATQEYLLTPGGDKVMTPDDKYVKAGARAVHLTKRFSISKAPDGQPGVAYNLIASVDAIRRKADGTLNPGSITFSAVYSDGQQVIAYIGRYAIELSTDGETYTEVYRSEANELSKTYTPPNNAFSVRCTLYDSSGNFLDMQSVIVIADADELAEIVSDVQEAVSTHETTITEISTGVEGMKVKMGNVYTELHGLSDGELIVNVETTYSDTTRTYTAFVYKGLEDIKSQYPAAFFKWYKETAEGVVFLNTGYSTTIQNSKIDRDGCVRLEFVPMVSCALQTPDGKYVLTPDNKRVQAYVEDKGQYSEPIDYDDIPGSAPELLANSATTAAPMQLNSSLASPRLATSPSLSMNSASPIAIQSSMTSELSLSGAESHEGIEDIVEEETTQPEGAEAVTDMDDEAESETETQEDFEHDTAHVSDEELETAIDEMIGEVLDDLAETMKSDMYSDEFDVVEDVTEDEGGDG